MYCHIIRPIWYPYKKNEYLRIVINCGRWTTLQIEPTSILNYRSSMRDSKIRKISFTPYKTLENVFIYLYYAFWPTIFLYFHVIRVFFKWMILVLYLDSSALYNASISMSSCTGIAVAQRRWGGGGGKMERGRWRRVWVFAVCLSELGHI